VLEGGPGLTAIFGLYVLAADCLMDGVSVVAPISTLWEASPSPAPKGGVRRVA